MTNTLKLWRKEPDGIKLKELHPDMFADMDSYDEAVDFAYMRGFSEDYPIDYGVAQGDNDYEY